MSKHTKLALHATASAMLAVTVAPMLFSGTATAQAPTGALTGSVWFDRDGDGAQGNTERGRAGAVVKASGSGGEFVVLADANGKYTFRDIPFGAYDISHSDPAFANTTPKSVKVALSAGKEADPVRFGVRGATICGIVWRDTNEDGKRQADEPRIPNSAVGMESDGTNYTNSDAEGNYCLHDVPAGQQVLGANDRALFNPSEGWTQEGGDSKFGFSTGRTQPIAVGAGAEISGIDAGYRLARMDMRTSQLLMISGDTTFDMTSPGFSPSIWIGDEFTIVGGVYPDGNVAEQLGAKLTLPAGLKLVETFGGMPSSIQDQSVVGSFHGRRHPGLIEFIGAKVRVESAFRAADVRLEVAKGVYGDSNPANNVLTASIAAIEAENHQIVPPPTTTAAVVQAGMPKMNVAKTSATASLAETGSDPMPILGAGVCLVAAGGAAMRFARRRVGMQG